MGGCLRRRWGLGESISFFFSFENFGVEDLEGENEDGGCGVGDEMR